MSEKTARDLDIARTTVLILIKKDSVERKPCGGRRTEKLLSIHLKHLREQMEEDCTKRLKRLTEILKNKFDLNISSQAIRKRLDGLCYSYKKIHFEPGNMNSPENKTKPKIFADALLEELVSESYPVFYDESNVNLY